jgi:hypothetical protein
MRPFPDSHLSLGKTQGSACFYLEARSRLGHVVGDGRGGVFAGYVLFFAAGIVLTWLSSHILPSVFPLALVLSLLPKLRRS